MNETILLVEDDEGLRRLAQRLLAKLGYTVLAAGDGKTAVATCRDSANDIKLLITDVFMPDIGGPELAQKLLEILPAMKVLYVSGSDAALSDAGIPAPSSHFLQKPYTQDQIRTRIREILDQA
jgi:two-component system, cell cycle sensor histidine kinase and response regulator CckA